jgi:NTP pyrophosphatase (non-canonical NTP hydrolase)
MSTSDARRNDTTIPPSLTTEPARALISSGRVGGTLADEYLAAIKSQAAENAERWAAYERTPAEHLLLLIEEIGEVANSMQGTRDHYLWPPAYTRWTVEELIDAGAVILAMLLNCPREDIA